MIRDPKRQYDGFISLEGGVDSGRSPSILNANQLAWAVNATVRGGFATCRPGLKKLELSFPNTNTQARFENNKFQGAGTYVSLQNRSYLCSSHGGRIFTIDLGGGNAVSDISITGNLNNPTLPKVWFQQAESWLIVQDQESKPILWDGATSRRATDTEVPVGGPMAYGRGRLWVANGRQYYGGDLVWTDDTLGAGSVINFTENTFLAEGGAFAVPSSSGGVITGMSFAANLDTSLGDGDLLVFTDEDVYAFDAPIDRTEWAALTYPIQRYALLDYGTYSHTSIVRVNGDLFYRSRDGIRSLMYARRDFTTRWGNTPISEEMRRALAYDTQRWLYAASAVNFDNRMLATIQPERTDHGMVHRGLVVLDFDPVSSMADKLPPVWEGIWTGLRVLHILKLTVKGEERCFIYALNEFDVIEVWELTRDAEFDSVDEPISWIVETRSMGMSSHFEAKKLAGADFWVDGVKGDITVEAKFRSDLAPCWFDWATATDCATYRDCATGEECHVPRVMRAQTRNRIALPSPPDHSDTINGTLARFGGEFQLRLELSGRLAIRKLRIFAEVDSENLYGTPKTTECVTPAQPVCQTEACKEETCADTCVDTDFSYVTPDSGAHEPIEETITVYYGRSANTTLTETQIEALTALSTDDIAGQYVYGAGAGYLYFCTPVFPTDITSSGFAVAMASAAQGYFGGSDPMRYTITTIDGEIYYVFRTYNICLGSINFDVT